MPDIKTDTQKTLFVTIMGSPNAGKSSLLNKLVDSKISIISPKAQTTRNVINGICIVGNTQLVFCDTPGIIHKLHNKMEQEMMKRAWNEAHEADMVAFLLDAKVGITPHDETLIKKLATLKIPRIAILNKIDLIRPNKLLPLIAQLDAYTMFDEIFMVSSTTGENVETLRDFFASKGKDEHWPYDEDQLTSAPLNFLATEIVREQLFLQLDQELPYQLEVVMEKWEEKPDGSVKLYQAIHVNKESHKKIIVGRAGSMIKSIGQAARAELDQLVEKKVHLFLFVKTVPNRSSLRSLDSYL
jgi:GTP-binding protein Era